MLDGWSNFFNLTGTAGATLVGLLFIVITLNTDLSTSRTLEIARASMTRSALHLQAIRRPVDWIFHNAVPVGASVLLILGGAGWVVGAVFAPFAIAGACTLLLASGIYRTWGETLALIGTRDKS